MEPTEIMHESTRNRACAIIRCMACISGTDTACTDHELAVYVPGLHAINLKFARIQKNMHAQI